MEPEKGFFLVSWVGWVPLIGRSLFALLYQPQMIDEYGAFGGRGIGWGIWSIIRKPAGVPFYPPQIPPDLN
jgi:hypothetical protein